MPFIRTKPVVLEAFQMTMDHYDNNSDWPEFLHKAWNIEMGKVGSLQLARSVPRQYEIVTLAGRMEVNVDDWIIKGVHGELYLCKPEDFDRVYEPIAPFKSLLAGYSRAKNRAQPR